MGEADSVGSKTTVTEGGICAFPFVMTRQKDEAQPRACRLR